MNYTNKDVCSACTDLEKLYPNFVQHGITDEMCNSIKNNQGITSSDTTKNCTDLHLLNDCLIAGQTERIPSYDQCDWDKALIDSLKNVTILYNALICSDCGQWENIEALWDEINKLWAEIEKIWKAIRDLQSRVDDLEDITGNLSQRVEKLENWKTTVDKSITNINNSVSSLNTALKKVLQNLKDSGAWTSGNNILDGNFVNNRKIASGNINLFSGTADGNSFIKTSNSKTENDIYAGV